MLQPLLKEIIYLSIVVETLLLINLVCQIKYLFKVWETHNDSLIFSSPIK